MGRELLAILGKALELASGWLRRKEQERAEKERLRTLGDGAGALLRLFNPAAEKGTTAPAHPADTREDGPGRPSRSVDEQ